ncbi:MAG: hypothetical protein IPM21_17970 [Acidobacteria bacterium]|nr:hypothetical protein [Acidobacteriota bacterium]
MISRKLLFVYLFLICGCSLSGHPSDNELMQRFSMHKADFVRLSVMLEEDNDIVRMTNGEIFFSGESRQIPSERRSEYRSLIEKLELDTGIHRDNVKSVRLIASSKGFSTATSEKSFLHSTEDVGPLADSLDNLGSKGKQPSVYKKLDDHWYIVFESW